MSIKEMIEQKEKELEELKTIQTSVKDTVYAFYNAISSVVTRENYSDYVERARKGFSYNRLYGYNLYYPQRSPLIRDYTRSVVADAVEEVTGTPGTSIDDLDIKEIAEVRSLVQSRLDEWLERYWF